MVAEDGGRYDAWSVVDLDDNEDVATQRREIAGRRVRSVAGTDMPVALAWDPRDGRAPLRLLVPIPLAAAR